MNFYVYFFDQNNKTGVKKMGFNEFLEAKEFIINLPKHQKFFALTDGLYNYILESSKCKKIRSEYETSLKPAIDFIKAMALKGFSNKTNLN